MTEHHPPSVSRPAFLNKQQLRELAQLPRDELFSSIYAQQLWGQSKQPFYSGDGSHDPALTERFIQNIKAFIRQLPAPPVIVDTGCGDFAIGRQLHTQAAHYHACDIVPQLMAHNRAQFQADNLSFHLLDACRQTLPEGNVLLIRQVFQHLSNQSIRQILSKANRFAWLIVTEHVPGGAFTPNHDKADGPDSRLRWASGVCLEAAPFNLTYRQRLILDEAFPAEPAGSCLRTTAYAQPALPPDKTV